MIFNFFLESNSLFTSWFVFHSYRLISLSYFTVLIYSLPGLFVEFYLVIETPYGGDFVIYGILQLYIRGLLASQSIILVTF